MTTLDVDTDVAAPTADRDQFIRDNAVALVRELEARVGRLRLELRRHHQRAVSYKRQMKTAYRRLEKCRDQLEQFKREDRA